VTLATRHPVKFAPQRPLGRDVDFWSAAVGFDHLPISHLLRTPPTPPVNDPGIYRAAIDAGRPDQRRMSTAVENGEVVWSDGKRESVDAIILATGFRPDLNHLRGLGALDAAFSAGRPGTRRESGVPASLVVRHLDRDGRRAMMRPEAGQASGRRSR
jgi:putative flavoprotein involved in K+ transport